MLEICYAYATETLHKRSTGCDVLQRIQNVSNLQVTDDNLCITYG